MIKWMWLWESVTAKRWICLFSVWRVFVKTMHREHWNPEGGRATVFLLCCSPRIFRIRTDPEVIRPRPNVAYWLVSAVSCTQSQQMKKCLYGMLRYERETVDVSRGVGGGIMRLGRDATRGVTATAQEKRGINNGGGAWENGMEWKWFRWKGGIDIVQGEIYRNKMWSVEIINSDEIRVKDIWSLEMLSKIGSSKRHHLS